MIIKKYLENRKYRDLAERSSKEAEFYHNELKRLISLLSNDEWKEWDNAMECIDTAQERKYMQYHKEDVITIFSENMDDPEEAARQLLEYFEIEVKEGMERGKMTFIYE